MAAAFLKVKGVDVAQRSGYEQMVALRDSGLVGDEAKEILEHLTMSLEKDDPQGESYWPLDVELLDEVERLGELLGLGEL